MKYTCEKYPELSFYVGGKVRCFVGGEYETTIKLEQEALGKIPEVKKMRASKGDRK